MPFLTSLLFPPLPFGRGKGSIYNIDHFYWELQMSPCLSRNGEMPLRGMWQVTERVILKSWSFFQNCHFLPKNILYAERLQHKCSCCSGHAHIALGIFVHRIHTCRVGKDLIYAGKNLVYALFDWQFSRCFLKAFPALKLILSSWIIYPSASLSFRDKYFQMSKHNSWDRNKCTYVVWPVVMRGLASSKAGGHLKTPDK